MTSNERVPDRHERYLDRMRAAENTTPATLHDRFVGGCFAAGAGVVVLSVTVLSAGRARDLALVAFLALVGMAVYRYIRGGRRNVLRLNGVDGAVVGIWLGAFFNMIGGVHLFGFLNPFAVVGRTIVLLVFSLIGGCLTWLLRRTGSRKQRERVRSKPSK